MIFMERFHRHASVVLGWRKRFTDCPIFYSIADQHIKYTSLWLVKLVERTGPLYSYVREQVTPVG